LADYNLPAELYYSKDDEWVRVEEDGRCYIGISDFAQQQLGDIVFVELPEVDTLLENGDTFGVVESVKAVADLHCPVGGNVVAVNDALEDAPETVNQNCYEEGWIIVLDSVSQSELDQLMNAQVYAESIASREE